MKIEVLSRRSRWALVALSLALGSMLAVGFIPTALSLFAKVFGEQNFPTKFLAFPVLAGLFMVSLPPPTFPYRNTANIRARLSLIFPVLIAFLYGAVDGQSPSFTSSRADLIWYTLSIPIGEECLFRGWIVRLGERIWPRTLFTWTTPLPASIWLSSLCFGIWHFQNITQDPALAVVFQAFYTLIVGFWLGYVYWITGKIWICIFAHAAINIAPNFL